MGREEERAVGGACLRARRGEEEEEEGRRAPGSSADGGSCCRRPWLGAGHLTTIGCLGRHPSLSKGRGLAVHAIEARGSHRQAWFSWMDLAENHGTAYILQACRPNTPNSHLELNN